MKAKMSLKSVFNSLTPVQRDAVVKWVEHLWQRKAQIIERRFKLATALALSDIEHLGDKHIGYVLKGIDDILQDYSEQSYTASEARNGCLENGDYDEMAARMQRELSSRPWIKTRIVDYEEEIE